MRNCLKTQLKEAVQNDSLLKMAEMVITVHRADNSECTTATQQINFYGLFEYIEIVGDGYFLSGAPSNGNWSDGTGSIGKIINNPTSGRNVYYASNGDYTIKLSSKYSLPTNFGLGYNLSFSLNDILYSSTIISDVSNINNNTTGTTILPLLKKLTPESNALELDLRNTGCSFSLKEFLDQSIVGNVSRILVSNTNVTDTDAATVAAIQGRWPGCNIVVN